MKTLIFKSNGKPNSNSLTVEFVKEGTFEDAMNFFDDKAPVFVHTPEDSPNFDSSIDPEGYYTDESGDVIVTFTELKNSTEHINNVDNTFFRNYYTVEGNNLSDEEIEAVIRDGYEYLIEEVLEDNGYSYEAYTVCKHFGKDNELLWTVDDWERFAENDYIISNEEPVGEDEYEDIDFIEVDGKYYIER